MLKIVVVSGARPNFVKVAPIVAQFQRSCESFRTTLVHTGQHYDEAMSDSFFRDLNLPAPNISLEVGSASHAQQTGEIMKRFEPILQDYKPDYVLVVGDVNSTLACALTASKLGIGVIHVEAGLRSFDRSMPEEINRVMTDHLSDLLFVTEESGRKNLLREGISAEKIHFVGNVMIDSLRKQLDLASRSDVLRRYGLTSGKFGLVTLHRPSNVDHVPVFKGVLQALERVSREVALIFPLHPRTQERVRDEELASFFANREGTLDATPKQQGLYGTPPVSYLEFLELMRNARIVLTDSGGVQEETTALSIPCLTLRNNTERPSTVEIGTNQLVGTDPNAITKAAFQVLASKKSGAAIPPLWDGRAAERIASALLLMEAPSGVATLSNG